MDIKKLLVATVVSIAGIGAVITAAISGIVAYGKKHN